jgi:hypothetical protein
MSSNQAIRPISAESPQALASPGLPEAAGAGSFYPDGSVRFGDQAEPPLRAHIEPRRDPEEVARKRAAIPYRCGFCAGIPADLLGQLAEIGAVVDLAHLTEQQRLAEDDEPLPRKAEDRTAHLIDRIGRGTYTPPQMFREADDLSNGEPISGCGIVDEFNRCSARFHDSGCVEVLRSSASSGSHEAVSQFKDVLMANTRTAIELATRTGPDFDDLLEDPGPTDQPTYQAMREVLGLSGKQSRPQPARRPATVTPGQLGIF